MYRRIRNEWITLSRGIRIVVLTLLSFFVLLGTWGILGDFGVIWQASDFAFSTNLLAGATAACFGIPLATIVLRKVTQGQLDRRDAVLTGTLVRNHVESLQDHHSKMYSQLRPDRAMNLLDRVDRVLLSAHEAANRIGSDAEVWSRRPQSGPYYYRTPLKENLRPEIRRILAEAKAEIADVLFELHQDIPSAKEVEQHWYAIQEQWRLLNESVKPRVMAQGLRWIESSEESTLHSRISAGGHGLLELVIMRDRGIETDLNWLKEIVSDTTRPNLGDLESLRLPRARYAQHEKMTVVFEERWEIGNNLATLVDRANEMPTR